MLDNPLKKDFTDQEIAEIKKDWVEEQQSIDYPSINSHSFERTLEQARNYYGDDYSNLANEQLLELDHALSSLTKVTIQKLIIKLGFAKGKDMPGWPMRNQYSKEF
jgi:hypothetical protein